jgi:hypothetical protein
LSEKKVSSEKITHFITSMKHLSLILVASAAFVFVSCISCNTQNSPFTTAETEEKIVLLENGIPVLVYQKKPKSRTGQYVCNNYIHPLFDLYGKVLTEEFPPDHPYHRGVFWAWHQLYAGGRRLGDGWTNDSIAQKVVGTAIEKDKHYARLKTDVLWSSPVTDDGKPFIEEKATITVHKLSDGIRRIDFEIVLKALADQLQIGGSADQKGYGGFCIRMRLPDSLKFTSDQGPVTPQELQIKAGPWMDFSGRFGDGRQISGITILCHPGTPGYPEPWILRQKGSMQNVVFPGAGRIDIAKDKTVTLHYRLIIHKGDAGSLNMEQLSKEYSKLKFN